MRSVRKIDTPARIGKRAAWLLLGLAALGVTMKLRTPVSEEPKKEMPPRAAARKVFTPPQATLWPSMTQWVTLATREEVDSEKIPAPLEELSPKPPERKQVSKTIPLHELPVSREFLRLLEEETEGSTEGVPRPSEEITVFGGGGSGHGVRKGETVEPTPLPQQPQLPPNSYRVVSFTPGTTESGKPIRTGMDLAALQASASFPPDFSLDTTVPARDRLVSLGHGGEITLEVIGGYVEDGPGPDFVVFENPFIVNGTNGKEVYAETAVVSVAEKDFPGAYTEFPCKKDQKPYRGCAGVVPVRYGSGRPLDSIGGDLFDLDDIGVSKARFIRIRDTGDNRSFLEGTEGFDLDAIGLIHTSEEKRGEET